MARTSYETRLPALHAHYTALINAAVGAGRMDLVEDLAGAYQDEAMELLLALDAAEGRGSDRQVEVLELLAEGLTNAEIADRLVVSVRTVDHHVAAVLAKLNVGSRREAARAAATLGA
jgi:DNA-binding NarL/FixJ family response regulator